MNRGTLRAHVATLGFLVAVGHGPVVLSGQGAPPDPVMAIEAIPTGRSLRIDVASVGRLEGLLVSQTTNALTLADGANTTEIVFADIERLWVRGRSTGRGAVIGGTVGFLLGVLSFAALSEVACGEDGGSCTGLGFSALGGLMGGVAGGAAGAGVGALVPRWRLRFP